MPTLFERLFDTEALIFFGVAGGLGLLIGMSYGLFKGESFGDVLKRAGETLIMTILGGFIARSFVGVLLFAAQDSPGSILAVGWFFLLWPGAIESIARLFISEPTWMGAEHLLWMAAAVGCINGLADGAWRIRTPAGLLTFIIDLTWGLAGATNGALFHVVNFVWGKHENDGRRNVHRYKSGFRFKGGFAVTQSHVMSNMGSSGPGSSLWRHENVHILQNRIFGPVFTLTYVGWMALFFIPSLFAPIFASYGLGDAIEGWCYFSNPWETWAYSVGGSHSCPAVWPQLASIIVGVLVGLAALAGTVTGAAAVWG